MTKKKRFAIEAKRFLQHINEKFYLEKW